MMSCKVFLLMVLLIGIASAFTEEQYRLFEIVAKHDKEYSKFREARIKESDERRAYMLANPPTCPKGYSMFLHECYKHDVKQMNRA